MNPLEYHRTLDALQQELDACDNEVTRIADKQRHLEQKRARKEQRRKELTTAISELAAIKEAREAEFWTWEEVSGMPKPLLAGGKLLRQWRLRLVGYEFLINCARYPNTPSLTVSIVGEKTMPDGTHDTSYAVRHYGRDPLEFACTDESSANGKMDEWKRRILTDHNSIITWQKETAKELHSFS